MENFVIEKMTEIDVEKVFQIENELLGTSSIETIKNTLKSKTTFYYVLKVSGEVVGFFECLIISPEAELFDIAVRKNCQGKGYSKFLMDKFLELAKLAECETILLEVNSINNVAINLYEKYNFKKYGIRKNYYGENDAILMKLEMIK